MTSERELPTWRSLLYVPVNVDRFVEKAPGVGADAIKLDLEDSIAPSEKDSARKLVAGAAEKVSRDGADVLVRINRPWRLAVRDIEAVVSPAIYGLALPKVDSADHVRMLSEVVSEVELERGIPVGHTKFMLLVETPDAFFQVREIAKADPRTIAMSLGSEDFTAEMNMVPDGETLLFPKQQIVIAARAAGILPLGFVGSIADFRDVEAFREIIRRSKRVGFDGASCIHPNQVMVCNEEFAPSAEDVEAARRMVEAYEDAHAKGLGSIQVDGKMVDIPVADRARAIIKRHEAIQARTG